MCGWNENKQTKYNRLHADIGALYSQEKEVTQEMKDLRSPSSFSVQEQTFGTYNT